MKRFAILALCTGCASWCGAPKPSGEDDPVDRDAAPHAAEAKSRCSETSSIALPGALELGRAIHIGTRVVVGARRANRAGLLEIDELTARFTELGDAFGDVPPPLPIASFGSEKATAVAYEGTKRHLVIRDSAASAIAELPPDPIDESLAFDAAVLPTGGVVVVWDAPTSNGSAIWASTVLAGKVEPAVRLTPEDVDGDTPRVVAIGPTIILFWLAHRGLPKSDAGIEPEGAGQDLDHAWVEMLAFDGMLHPTSPLRHITPDSGRVSSFDVTPRGGNEMDVVARDAFELHAGQGGTALLVRIRGPELPAPVVLAEHVGRGVPLLANEWLVFDDTQNRGRAAFGSIQSPEPVLDAARALSALANGDLLVAGEHENALHVVRCSN